MVLFGYFSGARGVVRLRGRPSSRAATFPPTGARPVKRPRRGTHAAVRPASAAQCGGRTGPRVATPGAGADRAGERAPLRPRDVGARLPDGGPEAAQQPRGVPLVVR